MFTTYKLKPDELDNSFIVSVKELYKNQTIEITVCEVHDDTDYLLSDDCNKEHLLNAINDVKENKNIVAIDLTELK